MVSIFEQLGVRTIVNAAGPVTRLSGARMDADVIDAMCEAAQVCVDIAELQAGAGQLIAEVTGAEAGYVTSGAAAGLVLATAACVTGMDPGKMNRLPDTSGMKNEVIIPRSHRNFYDHAVRSAGVSLIEVGISDRFSGAGVRDTEAWEIADAISDQTAAIVYVAQSFAQPPLPQVTAVAHKCGVPVIVDAAGQLPPAANLKRFIREGADAVCFSGGKTIGGPQGAEFTFHHSGTDYLVLTKQLESNAFIPEYATHYIGAGGVVINEREELLVVSELHRSSSRPYYKLPGGALHPGEHIADCVQREVFEETGVRTKFEKLVCFRHWHGYRYDKSDIYFVCRLSPLSEDISIQAEEIEECLWLPVPEYLSSEIVSTFNKHIVKAAIESPGVTHMEIQGYSDPERHEIFMPNGMEENI